jgi:2-haloacid dehalogenase
VPTVNRDLKSKLLDAYFQLDAFPDAREALQKLKSRGNRTGILSNGTPDMVKGAVDAAGIGDSLDAQLSVHSVRMYKPRPEVYALVTAHFKCTPRDVVFVSSNRWDVMGAAVQGFRAVWVNRSKMPDEYGKADIVLDNLTGLLDLPTD